ncbi:hypothetical protein [Acidovorax temperans]|uniref:hypothetical protein n=1 Tax=Acidovorax temperans TaxID=80878 RepID=UPI0035B395D2
MNQSHYKKYEGSNIKLVTSCVRNPAQQLPANMRWSKLNIAPRDGDLVLVRCLDSKGAYNQAEDLNGMPIRLYEGDLLLLVLATRRSGTNLIGEIPAGPIETGHRLDLVAQGGLVAQCVDLPAYYGTHALPLEVVAFATSEDGRILNLDYAPVVPLLPLDAPYPIKPTLFVCGTSAEVGKTTAVCNLSLALKNYNPKLRTAAIKACGTGRAKDSLHYRAANYDVVTDFIDAGLPSTYNISEEKFRQTLKSLVTHSSEHADFVVVEIGGDFLEAQAPTALAMMAEMNAHCIMMVNDAMGAMEGMRRLRELGRTPLMVGTFKQNLRALALRLELPASQVADSSDAAALLRVIEAMCYSYRSSQLTAL